MIRRVLVAAAAAGALTLGLVPAGATGTVVVAGAASSHGYYATPVAVTQPSGGVTFVNLDLDRHNVVHDVGSDGVAGPADSPWCAQFQVGACPLFWSALTSIGRTNPVLGLENLEPGEVYTFYCTIHEPMKGKLVVVPDA